MINKALFSSRRMDWGTPQAFFDSLNEKYHFTLDACANDMNHKCERYFTEERDGLKENWGGERVFCNPPYGRELPTWVKKCYAEAQKPNTLVVMLIPARTDTRVFHEYIYGKAEIEFIRGRLKFEGAKHNAPFPSMLVIYGGVERGGGMKIDLEQFKDCDHCFHTFGSLGCCDTVNNEWIYSCREGQREYLIYRVLGVIEKEIKRFEIQYTCDEMFTYRDYMRHFASMQRAVEALREEEK